MRRAIRMGLLAAVLPALAFGGDDALTIDRILYEPIAPFSELEIRRASAWIKDLEADSFDRRDAARSGLISLGAAARPHIVKETEAASRGAAPNPEVLLSLQTVLAAIDEGLIERKRERIFKHLERIVREAPELNAPPTPEAVEKMNQRITFEFVDTPIADALRSITVSTGVPVFLDPSTATVAINLRVSEMRAADALSWVVRLAELETAPFGDVVLITRPETARRLTLLRQTLKLPPPIGEEPWTLPETVAMADLIRQVGREKPSTDGLRRTFQVDANVAGELAIVVNSERLAEIKGWINRLETFEATDGTLLSPQSEAKLDAALKFDWNDASVGQVLATVQEKLEGLNIEANVDREAIFTEKGENVKVRDVLMVLALRMGWVIQPQSTESLLIFPMSDEVDFSAGFSFDLRPAYKAGISPADLDKALAKIGTESPQPMVVRTIRGRLIGKADHYTARRIGILLESAAKNGSLKDVPPLPWFSVTLKPPKKPE